MDSFSLNIYKAPHSVPKGGQHTCMQPDLPFFETNCEVTPTSKVAKTGLWSLVMMSVVQPANEKGRRVTALRLCPAPGRSLR